MRTMITDRQAVFKTGKLSGAHPQPGYPTIVQLILVRDDDRHWDQVEAELVHEGFVVQSFEESQAMLAAASGGLSADLVVLRCKAEKMLGFDLMSRIGADWLSWRMAVLPAHNSPIFDRLALDRGAADIVDKVRGMALLAARLPVIASEKRSSSDIGSGDVLHCGRLTLRSGSRRGLWDNIDVGLTLSEFKIVQLLACNAGSFISYRQIYDGVHHVGFIAGNGKDGYRVNVRSAIKRIRDKFRTLDTEFNQIQTFQSFGYCWGQAQERSRHCAR